MQQIHITLAPPVLLLELFIRVIVWGSLVVAIVLVALAWRAVIKSDPACSMRQRMGSVQWDFSRSWASNLSIAGSALGLVLTAIAMPEAAALGKYKFIYVNSFFAVLAIASPCVYNALREGIPTTTQGRPEIEYRGYVGMFLVAAVLTTWAVYGQLGALVIVVLAMNAPPGLLLSNTDFVFEGIVFLMMLVLIPYVRSTVYWNIRTFTLPPGEAHAQHAAGRPALL